METSRPARPSAHAHTQPAARSSRDTITERRTVDPGFVSANLIIYWGGFEATWKILTAIFIGRLLFEFRLRRADDVRREDIDWRAASWIWPWLVGITIIGLLGRYGKGAHKALPEWFDLLVVIGFSLAIFYYAVSVAMTPEQVRDAVAIEEQAQAEGPTIATA